MALGGHNRGLGWGGGDDVPPRLGVSRVFVMLVFLFCKLFEHYSQTNSHIIKTKPFKVTKIKNGWQIFRPKWVKKNLCHYFIL